MNEALQIEGVITDSWADRHTDPPLRNFISWTLTKVNDQAVTDVASTTAAFEKLEKGIPSDAAEFLLTPPSVPIVQFFVQ